MSEIKLAEQYGLDDVPTSFGVADNTTALPSAIDFDTAAKHIQSDYRGLLALLSKKLKSRELAADLVNEAIAVTLEQVRHSRLTQVEQIGGYVFQVSMNLFRNYQRNSNNRADIRVSDAAIGAIADSSNDQVHASQVRKQTLALINSLESPRDRQVVKRFYLDEEDKESICTSMSLTPVQFTQVMLRARQRLKIIFESKGLHSRDFFSFFL